jgi:hypothetical protein
VMSLNGYSAAIPPYRTPGHESISDCRRLRLGAVENETIECVDCWHPRYFLTRPGIENDDECRGCEFLQEPMLWLPTLLRPLGHRPLRSRCAQSRVSCPDRLWVQRPVRRSITSMVRTGRRGSSARAGPHITQITASKVGYYRTDLVPFSGSFQVPGVALPGSGSTGWRGNHESGLLCNDRIRGYDVSGGHILQYLFHAPRRLSATAWC